MINETSTKSTLAPAGERAEGEGADSQAGNALSKEIRDLSLERVFPNPDQPRKFFDAVKLQELADSIKEHGVQQPIKVVAKKFPRPSGERAEGEGEDSQSEMGFMIVMGERRYRASILAGMLTIPAMVEELTERQIDALSMIENLQRADITVIEEARKYENMISKGWTKEELAVTLGLKQEWRIDERLSLLKLTQENQNRLVSGQLGNSQAFEMSRVPDKQDLVLRKIQAGELGTYNKLRAFVDGLIAIENQETIFALTQVSAAERESMANFENMVRQIEKLISTVYEGERRKHLEKVAFHTTITPDRLDLIIQGLQRIRKTVLEGAGVKEAIAA